MYITPDDFSGNDSERLNRAVARAAELQIPVRIGKRCTGDGRDWWLLDSAILPPGWQSRYGEQNFTEIR